MERTKLIQIYKRTDILNAFVRLIEASKYLIRGQKYDIEYLSSRCNIEPRMCKDVLGILTLAGIYEIDGTEYYISE